LQRPTQVIKATVRGRLRCVPNKYSKSLIAVHFHAGLGHERSHPRPARASGGTEDCNSASAVARFRRLSASFSLHGQPLAVACSQGDQKRQASRTSQDLWVGGWRRVEHGALLNSRFQLRRTALAAARSGSAVVVSNSFQRCEATQHSVAAPGSAFACQRVTRAASAAPSASIVTIHAEQAKLIHLTQAVGRCAHPGAAVSC